MDGVKVIIKKEFKRIFQDKKLVFSVFLLPVIIVVAMYSLLTSIESSMEEDIEEHIQGVYIQNAPHNLEAVIESTGYGKTADITYISSDEDVSDIENKILEGDADLLVVFEDGFAEMVEAYSQAGDSIPTVTLKYNSTKNYSAVAYSEFNSVVLGSLSQSVVASRIENMELLTAFNTNTQEVVDEDQASGQGLAMMAPYLITILLFAGAMSLGVDTIAGEKERGTMASMLLSPVNRGQIVFGKLASLSLLSIMSAVISAVAMILLLPKAMGMSEGMTVSFSALQIVELIALMVVMAYLYVALVAFAATLAKDSKTASSYVSPIYVVVMVLGMLTMFEVGGEVTTSSYAIPFYGSSLAIQNIMTNDLTLVQFGIAIGVSLAIAVVATVGMTKAFNSEKIMFNA